MKKSIIAIAAMLASVIVAHSASIDWDVSYPGVGMGANTGGTFYLIGSDTPVSGNIGTVALASLIGSALDSASIDVWVTDGSMFGGIQIYTGDYAVRGEDASYYILAVNQDESQYEIGGVQTITGYLDGSTDQRQGFSWNTGNFTGTWTDVVPEPTSMAILALGVAALGLRRKL